MNRDSLYKSVAFRLLAAQRAYHAYLPHKSYVLALAIFHINEENRLLICENIHLVAPNDLSQFLELVVHWSQWAAHFKVIESSQKPKDFETFVFDSAKGSLPFPLRVATEIIEKSGLTQ